MGLAEREEILVAAHPFELGALGGRELSYSVASEQLVAPIEVRAHRAFCEGSQGLVVDLVERGKIDLKLGRRVVPRGRTPEVERTQCDALDRLSRSPRGSSEASIERLR